MEIETADTLAVLGHPATPAGLAPADAALPPQALPAGEIAEATGLKPSTLSVYLSSLRVNGLIEQEREGTSLR